VWRVVALDGRSLGSVLLPMDFELFQVSNGFVTGKLRVADDVEQVVVFAENDERGVGKVHRAVAVFVHQGLDAGKLVGALEGDLEVALIDEAPEGLLGLPTAGVAEQVHGLGEGWPSGQHRAGELGETVNARLVMLFTAVEDGDEGAGIGQDHRCLLANSLRKARPDLLARPPRLLTLPMTGARRWDRVSPRTS